MDFTAPLEAVFPGARAAVLAVLARAERPMTLRQIAERAGVSHPQVARHVERLELLGVVQREVAGRSHQVLLVDGAVGALVRRFCVLDDVVLERIRATVSQLQPNALSVVVFGSFVRGAAGPNSDIDLAIVAADPELPEWLEQLSTWIAELSDYAGSPVAEIVISPAELAARSAESFWRTVISEGVVVGGQPIDRLLSAATSVSVT